MTPMEIERPFNQPDSRLGKFLFAFIGWLENRIKRDSRVGTTPFFDHALFPWTGRLCADWHAVRAEAEALLALRDRLPAFQEISHEVGYITHDRQWKTFMLMGYGIRSTRNLAHCPATARAMSAIPGLRTAFFSILEPGKRLPPHRGPYNGVLRLHLGLVVPQPPERCWIRVEDQHRHWNEGEVLIFDDALEHEVHNDTDQPRVVLFVDFLRPCSGLTGWLNRFVVFAVRFSPLVRSARRNQARWEREFYGPAGSAAGGRGE